MKMLIVYKSAKVNKFSLIPVRNEEFSVQNIMVYCKYRANCFKTKIVLEIVLKHFSFIYF